MATTAGMDARVAKRFRTRRARDLRVAGRNDAPQEVESTRFSRSADTGDEPTETDNGRASSSSAAHASSSFCAACLSMSCSLCACISSDNRSAPHIGLGTSEANKREIFTKRVREKNSQQ